MREVEKIIKKLKEVNTEIKSKYDIKEIGIFGSYVKEEQDAESDVDILVDFFKSTTLFKFAELENLLSDTLGKKVDLVMKKTLKPRIGKHILDEVVYI